MSLVVAALLVLPATGFGAPYTPARIVAAPERKGCYVRYRLSTNDPIASVVAFYRSEATRAGVPLLGDTKAKFTDFRDVTFVAEPKFLTVAIDRENARTNIFVSYKIGNGPTCSTR